jgi:TPR repeat protein
MNTMIVPALLLLGACDNKAAEALLTCEGKNFEACYRDGMEASQEARPRFADARKSFSAACMEIHHAQSCNELAILVRDAKGGPRDVKRAVDLFGIACKGDVHTACVDLGLLLYKGELLKAPAPERAVELFTTECARVDVASMPAEGPHPLANACVALGTAYEEGKGVVPPKADTTRAAALYMQACDARYAPGCVAAGNLAAEKRTRDGIAEAAADYDRACQLDARQGCFELATLHEKKAWPDANDASASEYYQKTCNIDPTRGCFEAGQLMESGRITAREGEIEYLYNLACEHGHTEACARRNLE